MQDPSKTQVARAFFQPNPHVQTVFPSRFPLCSPMLALLGHVRYPFALCGTRVLTLSDLGINSWVLTPDKLVLPEYIPRQAREAVTAKGVLWCELKFKDLLVFDLHKTYHPMYEISDGILALDPVPALVADQGREFLREALTFARNFPDGRLVYALTVPAPA